MQSNSSSPKAMQMPDAFVILFFIMLGAALLSHWVPAGFYQLQPNSDPTSTVKRVDPASFQLATEQNGGVPLFAEQGGVGFLNYAFEGLVSGDKYGSAIGVVAFILLTGGAFGILMKTGAVNNGILRLIERNKR